MWNPREVRKLIIQLSGVVLGIGGLAMMLDELQASGLINLGRTISSGELSRGSVGLFLLCLSLLLIALPVLWGVQPIRGLRDTRAPFRPVTTRAFIGRLVLITAAALILSMVLLFGGELLAARYSSKVGALLQLLGIAVGVLSGAMVVFVGFMWVDAASRREPAVGENEPDQ